MSLDLHSLQKALCSLQSALRVASSLRKDELDTDRAHVIRAGVIQSFEFTYELCWKFIKRWLEMNGVGAMVDGATRKELFRIAAEHHLIDNVEQWFLYTSSRNETAYTYDQKTADTVYETAVRFVADAEALLNVLEEKNDG